MPARQRLAAARDRLARVVLDRLLRDTLTAFVDDRRLNAPLFFGAPERFRIAPSVQLNNAVLNSVSGTITIGEDSFLGHGVSLITGSHDPLLRGVARRETIPDAGNDIVIGRGVWLASNCTILGPCVIGDHAVVAAGAVVRGDVPVGDVVGGVPARRIRATTG